MTIQIKIKSVYGKELVYPANDNAERFARLIGQKTFNPAHIKIMEELGCKIEEVSAYTLTVSKEY